MKEENGKESEKRKKMKFKNRKKILKVKKTESKEREKIEATRRKNRKKKRGQLDLIQIYCLDPSFLKPNVQFN